MEYLALFYFCIQIQWIKAPRPTPPEKIKNCFFLILSLTSLDVIFDYFPLKKKCFFKANKSPPPGIRVFCFFLKKKSLFFQKQLFPGKYIIPVYNKNRWNFMKITKKFSILCENSFSCEVKQSFTLSPCEISIVFSPPPPPKKKKEKNETKKKYKNKLQFGMIFSC